MRILSVIIIISMVLIGCSDNRKSDDADAKRAIELTRTANFCEVMPDLCAQMEKGIDSSHDSIRVNGKDDWGSSDGKLYNRNDLQAYYEKYRLQETTIDQAITNGLKAKKGSYYVKGWTALKVYPGTYYVEFLIEEEGVVTGWHFEVNLINNIIRDATADSALATKYGLRYRGN